MKKLHLVFLLILVAAIVVLAARTLDKSLEVDDLKSQIILQKKSIIFLQAINKISVANCSVKKDDIEKIAKSVGYATPGWGGRRVMEGPFQIDVQDQCITRINLIGLP
jgi:hypothetical protein